ncbi:MAG TPA: NUDIX domain-containing protein [Candidatus Nanoarchaeia archaeon]|nr:NUDIX domain-containing protein [Candidatus Nanoarchaeia archaeon]
MEKLDDFNVIHLGIIFDTAKRKILIGRREKDPFVPKLMWTPPGGRITPGKDLEKSLKTKIKEQTGFEVENLGNIFAMIPKEKKNFVLLLYLCEVIGGREKVGGNLKELKWVKPEELDNYFTIAYHPHLREYILNLK